MVIKLIFYFLRHQGTLVTSLQIQWVIDTKNQSAVTHHKKMWHIIKKVKSGIFFKVDWKCRENLKVFWNAGIKTQTAPKCRDLLHI
jgi:hypothetical protein